MNYVRNWKSYLERKTYQLHGKSPSNIKKDIGNQRIKHQMLREIKELELKDKL